MAGHLGGRSPPWVFVHEPAAVAGEAGHKDGPCPHGLVYGRKMAEADGEAPEPDEKFVSALTLAQLASSPVPVTARVVNWITTAELDAVPDVDPFTAEWLYRLGQLSEDLSVEALSSVPREVVANACRRGGLSGYLFCRVLLGTHDRPVGSFPSHPMDMYAPVADMDLSFEMPRLWAEVTIDAIAQVVKGCAYADPEPDEPIGSSAALAFDQAMAIALIEHDRWLGRVPG